MASKFAIVLDIDGVLADFTYGVQSHLGREASSGAQPTWGFEGLTQELRDEWFNNPNFWYNLRPVVTDGDMNHLLAFKLGYGVEVKYVTNRHPHTREATYEWLSFHGLPEGEVVCTDDKVASCLELEDSGLTIIGVLEDSPRNLPDLQAAGFPVYIRDWMYNRHIDGDRVFSMGEFLYRMEKFCDSTSLAHYGIPASQN